MSQQLSNCTFKIGAHTQAVTDILQGMMLSWIVLKEEAIADNSFY